MKQLSSFVYSILAGLCIGIGGTVFLSLDNKVLGATFFSVGLFAVCTFGFNLFTGKVGYLFDNKPSYILDLISIWCGNWVGTFFVGWCVRTARISGITEKAVAMCQVKTDDTYLSLFILAIFCNILMFIAVDGYKNNPHEFGKYFGIFFGVVVFILCGFEHCIADMFYFSAAGAWNPHTFMCLFVMTLGNAVGGVMFPLARKLKKYADTAEALESSKTAKM